ncbi:MAG: hypothetical protein KF830_11910 [Planctomycetes bacterium]|nr:hypothetical protein [Planctomycetota bacterium]
MKSDSPRPSVPPSRRAGLVLALLAAASLGGCRFLADEFAWFDRPAPGACRAPDAAVSGLATQP